MTKITAEEARKLSGITVEEYADGAFELIRIAASGGKREIRLHSGFWVRGDSSEWKQVAKVLEDAGFKVSFVCDDRPCALPYTIVEWS